MNARRFELVDDKSAKFWEITQEGAEYTVCFGKIGTKGQAKTKTLASQDAAIVEVAKLIKEKTSKGYVEVGESLLERHRHTARVISDIEVISQSFKDKDVNQSLAILRKKGVEKLIIKWDACNDDGWCQVIAIANNTMIS